MCSRAGGTIVVFNNNTYGTAYGGPNPYDGRSSMPAPHASNILEIDPATDRYEVIYGGREGQEMLSIIRGKHEVTANGGLLVTEFEGGRVFEIDAGGNVIWEYINRYNSAEVLEITEARAYAETYFNISDWSCDIPS